MFKRFWNLYGLKRDKIGAERAWKRLGKKDRMAAMDGIAAYREDCAKRRCDMMYPQGYLTHRRWEDEFSEPENSPTPSLPKGEGGQNAVLQSVQPNGNTSQLSEQEQRSRQYDEQRRKASTWDDAIKSDEYWKAFNNN